MGKVVPWCGQPIGSRTAKEQNRTVMQWTAEKAYQIIVYHC